MWWSKKKECPSNAVCAYEWDSRLFKTQAEVKEAQRQQVIRAAEQELYEIFKRHDRSYTGLAPRHVAHILMHDWGHISGLVDKVLKGGGLI